MRTIVRAILVVVLFLVPAVLLADDAWTLSVHVGDRRFEGFPLQFSETQVSLLLRDGQIVEFSPQGVSQFKKVSSSFQPNSAGDLRAQLLRELSPKLEVTGTGHYVVAHPKNEGLKWANRFEELYRSMVHYFQVRGFTIQEPEFPMAAIVWGNREDFLRYAAAEGTQLPGGIIGYYSQLTNRVALYDMAIGNNDADAWRQNGATVIHEATHQTAFNAGIHTRMAETPRWVVEGLGTMFEPRGVWDSRQYPQLKDRINRERLADFREYVKAGRPREGFMLVVADDRLFQARPLAAYAEAWAFSFYLAEQEPRKYGAYLAKTAALKPFEPYPTQQRVRDFTGIFGSNLQMLDANFLRFIEGL